MINDSWFLSQRPFLVLCCDERTVEIDKAFFLSEQLLIEQLKGGFYFSFEYKKPNDLKDVYDFIVKYNPIALRIILNQGVTPSGREEYYFNDRICFTPKQLCETLASAIRRLVELHKVCNLDIVFFDFPSDGEINILEYLNQENNIKKLNFGFYAICRKAAPQESANMWRDVINNRFLELNQIEPLGPDYSNNFHIKIIPNTLESGKEERVYGYEIYISRVKNYIRSTRQRYIIGLLIFALLCLITVAGVFYYEINIQQSKLKKAFDDKQDKLKEDIQKLEDKVYGKFYVVIITDYGYKNSNVDTLVSNLLKSHTNALEYFYIPPLPVEPLNTQIASWKSFNILKTFPEKTLVINLVRPGGIVDNVRDETDDERKLYLLKFENEKYMLAYNNGAFEVPDEILEIKGRYVVNFENFNLYDPDKSTEAIGELKDFIKNGSSGLIKSTDMKVTVNPLKKAIVKYVDQQELSIAVLGFDDIGNLITNLYIKKNSQNEMLGVDIHMVFNYGGVRYKRCVYVVDNFQGVEGLSKKFIYAKVDELGRLTLFIPDESIKNYFKIEKLNFDIEMRVVNSISVSERYRMKKLRNILIKQSEFSDRERIEFEKLSEEKESFIKKTNEVCEKYLEGK